MSSGQWRVLVLLLVLLGLEAIRNPAVSGFFKALAVNPFRQATS